MRWQHGKKERGFKKQPGEKCAIASVLITQEESQEQVHRWDLGSREPSRTDHLSTPWICRALGSELPVAVAHTHTSCFSSSLGIMY